MAGRWERNGRVPGRAGVFVTNYFCSIVLSFQLCSNNDMVYLHADLNGDTTDKRKRLRKAPLTANVHLAFLSLSSYLALHQPSLGQCPSSTISWSVSIINHLLVSVHHQPSLGQCPSSTISWSVSIINHLLSQQLQLLNRFCDMELGNLVSCKYQYCADILAFPSHVCNKGNIFGFIQPSNLAIIIPSLNCQCCNV
ncbi:uncharacterized protein LOC125031902 [Penaeus chinensis]|uniref:uncharacterized protein LOC125031902 n=1 Tax=Penaeus chinensis TaxID=139456 RepID=UPI001FB59D5E|nr:uncharacterized protein LOC125031902 [Penaeus chinensis]